MNIKSCRTNTRDPHAASVRRQAAAVQRYINELSTPPPTVYLDGDSSSRIGRRLRGVP